MAIEGSLAAEERQELLLSTLREESRVGIEDAAKRLGVHPMTIRRALSPDISSLTEHVKGADHLVRRRARSAYGKPGRPGRATNDRAIHALVLHLVHHGTGPRHWNHGANH